MSSPTRYLSFFAKTALLPNRYLFFARGCAGVGVHNHLPGILKINGMHVSGIGLPLRKIFHEHAEFTGEIALAKVHGDGVRVGVADAKPVITTRRSLRIAEIQFADVVG